MPVRQVCSASNCFLDKRGSTVRGSAFPLEILNFKKIKKDLGYCDTRLIKEARDNIIILQFVAETQPFFAPHRYFCLCSSLRLYIDVCGTRSSTAAPVAQETPRKKSSRTHRALRASKQSSRSASMCSANLLTPKRSTSQICATSARDT